jgi:hypothetical protein
MIIQNPILTGSVALNGLNLTATNLATTSSNSFTSDQSITGSLGISANTTIAGTLTVTGSIVGLATSASYVLNAVSSSKALSASYSDTASFANSFTVMGNLTVFGTQSVQYITSSQLNVANNVITVNVGTPGIRFGGLSVFDSGSTAGATGSLFWDSQNNHWVYQQTTGSTYTGGMLISGPRNTGGLGNEVGTTNNSLMKGMGGDHITSSAIFEVSGSVTMGNATTNLHSITGSMNITGSVTASGTYYTGGDVISTKPVGFTLKTITTGAWTALYGDTGGLYLGTNAGNWMFINNSGNVGIGTVSPASQATGTTTGILDVSAATGGNLVLHRNGSGDTALFSILKASNGTYIDSTGAATAANNAIYFRTNNINADQTSLTTALTISSGGNIGIGTTGPDQKLTIQAAGTANGLISFKDSAGTTRNFIGQGNATGDIIATSATNDLCFRTQGGNFLWALSNIEFMRFTAGGNILLGVTSDTGARVNAKNSSSGTPTISATNTSASDSRCYYGQKYSGSTDDYYMVFDNAVANKFLFYGNGGLGNVQANNANISDRRTKKDIISLESYWNKFKAIEIVKFKYIDQDHDDYNIGLIAQQLEEVAPEFIDSDSWGKDTPMETEVPLKTVYTTDLYHATIKVLQEAMAKIEILEAEIEELKNK